MLTLYYSPGACSLAPHMALEETGATYALQLVSIPKGEQQASEYLNVNPRGKIPALRTDEGTLTENVAILTYIAARFRRPDCCRKSRSAWHAASRTWRICRTRASGFTHIVRPGRFATNESAQENVKATGRENAWKLLQELDGLLPSAGVGR
jgi:glutathione S-transferase